MEISIMNVCIAEGITGEQLFRKHGKTDWRLARIMLWTHLVRENGYSYGCVAKRFGCSKRNVIWGVREFEGRLVFDKKARDRFFDFKERARLGSCPASLRI